MNLIKSVKNTVFKGFSRLVNTISQGENRAKSAPAEVKITDGMPRLLREAAAEGAVLLKNDGVLPFKKDKSVAVFGRCQRDWFFVGYGSGGDVVKPYAVNLVDGIKNVGGTINEELDRYYKEWCENNAPDHGFWGHWPRFYPEAPIEKAQIEKAAETSDAAIVIIGRAAGEDRENTLEEGSFYLTAEEKALLSGVTEKFKKTAVILNTGNVTDFNEILSLCKNDVALLLAWQGGMESGNAVADLIFGDKTPSGKMISTVAKRYEDYPSARAFGNRDFNNYEEDIFVGYRYFETFAKDAVLFPFGFGLSYAEFSTEITSAQKVESSVKISFKVKNTSEKFSGKEVVEVYGKAPQGALSKPERVLCAFLKTDELLLGEEKEYSLSFPLSRLASFDDSGASGNKSCFVLEAGEYEIFVGSDVRSAKKVFGFTLQETLVLEKLSQCMAPKESFMRLTAVKKDGEIKKGSESVPLDAVSLKAKISKALPHAVPLTGNRGLKLSDVKDKKCTLDEFTAQLSLTELEAISRGDYIMNSPLGAEGNAGAFGGVLQSLRDKGVKPIVTTDGPSGIRLKASCSLLPIGSLLSSTWNEALLSEVYKKVGEEMKERGSDVLLAPGMNIHRNPLCGRNFEYFSEDPLLSGKSAAAVVRGLQSAAVSACPKHFACNNQETNRTKNDSRVSERALREIYLKNFEICIKESSPLNIMTSYNKVNGVWSHYNYDLCTQILRNEWHYEGNVITDWWMQKSKSPEFPEMRDNAYRVRAQVDVLMPGGERVGKRKPDGTLLKTYNKPDGITLGELQRTAKNVLKTVLALKY